MSRDGNDTIRTVLLVLAGGVAGATVALLFAPQSGKRTRRDIVRFGRHAATRAEELQRNLQDRVEELVEDFVEASTGSLERGREVTTKVRNEVVEALQSGRDLINRNIDRVEKVFSR